MTLSEISRQAAIDEWFKHDGREPQGHNIIHEMADAVAVAVLQEVRAWVQAEIGKQLRLDEYAATEGEYVVEHLDALLAEFSSSLVVSDQQKKKQEKDFCAGLIHQVASPLAETLPRPTAESKYIERWHGTIRQSRETLAQKKGWLAHCIIEAAANYHTDRRLEFLSQADAAIDAYTTEIHAEGERKIDLCKRLLADAEDQLQCLASLVVSEPPRSFDETAAQDYIRHRVVSEPQPTICPWCEHVIDNCRVVPCEAHAHPVVSEQGNEQTKEDQSRFEPASAPRHESDPRADQLASSILPKPHTRGAWEVVPAAEDDEWGIRRHGETSGIGIAQMMWRSDAEHAVALHNSQPIPDMAGTEPRPNDVAEEIERSLDWIERESFIVDYAVIKRGAGGLGAVVELSTATHAMLFIRRALRDSVLAAPPVSLRWNRCEETLGMGGKLYQCIEREGHAGIHAYSRTITWSTPLPPAPQAQK